MRLLCQDMALKLLLTGTALVTRPLGSWCPLLANQSPGGESCGPRVFSGVRGMQLDNISCTTVRPHSIHLGN